MASITSSQKPKDKDLLEVNRATNPQV